MTQQAKQSHTLTQRPVSVLTDNTYGLTVLFGSEQLLYASYPVGPNAGITCAVPNLLDTYWAVTTTSTSPAAWSTSNVTLLDLDDSDISGPNAAHHAYALDQSRISHYRKCIQGINERFLAENPFSVQLADLKVANVGLGRISNEFVLLQNVGGSSSTIALAPAWNDPIGRVNYESNVVVQERTNATQNTVTQVNETVEHVILNALPLLPMPEKASLAYRLREIQQDILEEGDATCKGISIPSLRAFFSFLKINEDLKLPSISATPDCNIYASWKKDNSHLFSVHFLREDVVRFVIFRPNEKHHGLTIRISGTATADTAAGEAAPHGIRAWASR